MTVVFFNEYCPNEDSHQTGGLYIEGIRSNSFRIIPPGRATGDNEIAFNRDTLAENWWISEIRCPPEVNDLNRVYLCIYEAIYRNKAFVAGINVNGKSAHITTATTLGGAVWGIRNFLNKVLRDDNHWLYRVVRDLPRNIFISR